MAEAVINIFETVEIDEQNTDVVIAEMLCLWQGLCQAIHKERTVGQARQGIMRCLVLQLLVGVFLVCDVLDLKDQVRRSRL